MRRLSTRRKILNNYNKSKRINGHKKGVFGTTIDKMDKNKEVLSVGDDVKYFDYEGVLLYDSECDEYGVALSYSMWYGDDKYDLNSYGKFIPISLNNGTRMNIEKLHNDERIKYE